MGVKSYFHEVKAKVSPSRFFKALILESTTTIPKVKPDFVKSIDVIGGGALAAGCITQTNFPDGAPFKYVKHRIDAIDTANCVIKFSLIEGAVLGDKLEKIVYEEKFESSGDGGCVVKVTSEYHTKGNAAVTDEEVEAGKQQSLGIYKAAEEYLIANPHVCA